MKSGTEKNPNPKSHGQVPVGQIASRIKRILRPAQRPDHPRGHVGTGTMNVPWNVVRFTKNIKLDRESWDYGHKTGLMVSIVGSDNEPILRYTVEVHTQRTIRKAVYAPPERIYLNLDAGEKPPVRELEEWEQKEDGMTHERYPIFFDADDKPYYELPAQVVDPGETRPLTRDEMAAAQVDAAMKLYEWCEHVYQAGRLLAEGRVELPNQEPKP